MDRAREGIRFLCSRVVLSWLVGKVVVMRRYAIWSGNPKGYKEDPEQCAVEIGGKGLWGAADARQCERKRGHGKDGILCTTHAKAEAAGKELVIPEDK